MSKSIKVSEEVYQKLLALQRPRETFSQVVERLADAADLLRRAIPALMEKRSDLQERYADDEGTRGSLR